MMKKLSGKKYIGLVFLFLLLLFVFSPVIVDMIAKIKDYREDRIDEMMNLNGHFVDVLHINGDFEVTTHKVKVLDIYEDDKISACIDVYYYNMYNEDKLSYDTIRKEYDNFCKGKGKKSYKNLANYTDYMNQIFWWIFPDKSSRAEGKTYYNPDLFREICIDNMPDDYISGTVDWSQNDVNDICNAVMQYEDELYLYNIGYGFKQMNSKVMDSQFNTYYLFSQVSSEIDLNEDSADITREADNGNIILHFVKSELNPSKYIITYMEMSGDAHGNVLGHGLGDSYDVIMNNLFTRTQMYYLERPYNATENSIEIEFDDNVNIVYEFNDEGICTKIVYGVLD